MAEIISMADRRPRPPRAKPERVGFVEFHSARVLLFTGIRYERLETATPSYPQAPGGSGKTTKQ
ncbi:hypothetical protein [Ensifer soli]|uniref:hypothetical protein n=1 Tax=Ciceribacter sp. sgz301302 TaxID=3342379 RepID=UPI0035B84D9D